MAVSERDCFQQALQAYKIMNNIFPKC